MENFNKHSSIDERLSLTEFLISQTEITSQEAIARTNKIENEKRERINGDGFTIAGLNDDFLTFISEVEKNHEPRFSLFFKRFGILCNWSDEEKKRYRKPRIAAIAILELFYARFPNGTVEYLREHNKYIGYCIRRTKNYKFFNEDGIRKLEEMLDQVNTLMPNCKTYYHFREEMYRLNNVPYQIEIF